MSLSPEPGAVCVCADVFARLSHRDGKDRYLDDIPLTMHYLLAALKDDTELSSLYNLIVSRTEG